METQTETGLPIAEFHTVVALGLTVLFAGLGHLYRRRFRRGVMWGLLFVCTLFLSTYPLDFSELFVVSVISGDLSPMNVAVPGSIMLLCLADLYLLDRAKADL